MARRKAKGRKASRSEVFALPPLPTYVFTALGEVPVTLVESIPDLHGKPSHDLGYCDYHKRFILIRGDLNPATMWHTLAHETFHFVIFDSGIRLSHNMEEMLCDAYATHFFQEMVTRRK